MKELKQFLKEIKEGRNGYSLGEPWKFSDESVGVVVPILKKNAEKRDYITYPEVHEDVDFEDKGGISPITATPNIDKSIFIRAGTVLEGISGQDRAVIHSMIFDNIKDIDVRCVHASRPTHRGGKFKYQGFAPRKVQTNLRKGQNRTWNSVNVLSAQIGSGRSHVYGASLSHDDLPSIKKAQKKLDKNLQSILKQVPVMENQVGAIIVGLKGVVGIEAFNHPKSWKSQYKEVIEQYSDELSKKIESELISFDDKKVNHVIKKFLTDIAQCSEFERIDENSHSIKMQRYIGEAVTLNNHIVHLFVMEDEDDSDNDYQGQPMKMQNYHFRPMHERVIGTAISSPEPKISSPEPKISDFFTKNVTKKGFSDIFNTINKSGGKATWSELERGTNISTRTLSNRLKEGKQSNIIGECIKKGRKAYYRK